MIIDVEGCQLECLDQSTYDTDLQPGELFVSRGKLFTCREVERSGCEYPKRFCTHFPTTGHPVFLFSEETAKPASSKEAHKVIAIDGEKM